RRHRCASVVAYTTLFRSSSQAVGLRRVRMIGLPEVVEVEPVVWRGACMVRQPAGVALDQSRQQLLAMLARHVDALAEQLEGEVVAPPAAVQANRQHHRYLAHGRD